MSDNPREFDGEEEQTRSLAPENDNDEQDDEAAQTEAFVDDARTSGTELGLDASEKVSGGIEPADAQDLVDHMEQMVTSGRIDMSAFRGEPNLDDEDDAYGPGADPDASDDEFGEGFSEEE